MSDPSGTRVRRLSAEDVALWRDYERRAANAADQYEALPTIHRCMTRALKCPRCRTDVPARGECRACRRKR